MQHMDARPVRLRQRDQPARRGERGEFVAPDRMRRRIARNPLPLACVQPRLVLAVEGGAPPNVFQNLAHACVVGDQQRSRRRAHEHFYARRARQPLQFGGVFRVLMRAADPKGKIAMHPRRRPRNLVGKRLGRGGERVGVGHFEHGGDAAEHGGRRAGLQVFLVNGAGLAEMHLAVDHAGQDVQPPAIHDFAGGRRREIADAGDFAAGDPNVPRKYAVLVDHRPAAQDHIIARHGRPPDLRTKACIRRVIVRLARASATRTKSVLGKTHESSETSPTEVWFA